MTTRFAALTFLLAAGAAVPAQAAEPLPARKPGLWDVRTVISVAKPNEESHAGPPVSVRQCIDADTDHLMMSLTGPLSQAACGKSEVQRSGDTVSVVSTCTFKDKTATTRAVITGSLDSAYTMNVTAQGDALPGGGEVNMTVSGKWLGQCADDQKPGDMIMENGLKLNLPEMLKRAPSQGVLPQDR